MSQHNIIRRLKALERDVGARFKARTAHIGCIPFIGPPDLLDWIEDNLDSLKLTDDRGVPTEAPTDKNKLANALREGQLLIFGGVCRVQIIDEEYNDLRTQNAQ